MDGGRYRIVYEDEWFLIIDKPSGMLVIPAPGKESGTLTDLLNKELDNRGVTANAYPCHRIDRETSGLVVYTKGKAAQKLMMEEFKRRAVRKTYIAFVHGTVKKNSDIIRSPIYNRKKRRSEEAVTRYSVMERRPNFSVLKVEPVTGRTNQIRIHMKALGHPLVGESVYAFRKDYKLRFKRAALHASHIEFDHPVIKKRMVFTSPLPKDMAGLIKDGGKR
jgi:23S rRNA pseudouridine1911/1915/1917 synthase